MSDHAAVLMYHRIGDPPPGVKLWALYVSKMNFAFQMWYLKKFGFNIVPLRELFRLLDGGGKLPQHTVAVTFDDGFEDFYRDAFPVISRHGIPASLFMVTGQAGRAADWDGIDLSGGGRIMTEAMARELAASGLVDILPHTRNHVRLPKVSPETARAEIAGSLDDIESLTGRRPEIFAAPYGEFDRSTVAVMRDLGIRYAAGTDNRAARASGEDLMALPRIIVRRNNHAPGFAYKMRRVFKNGK